MTLEPGHQIIKTRDDFAPVRIQKETTTPDPKRPFVLSGDTDCPWIRDDKPFGPETLRPRIEPWLTALAQSEHLSLLVGSGLTHAVHGIATSKLLPGMQSVAFKSFASEISLEAKRVAKAAGRREGNFEDQIRVANELLRGLEIIPPRKEDETLDEASVSSLREELKDQLESFADSILAGERNLATADNVKRERAFDYLVSFLTSFASRSGTRERLHIFTTNYDRYIEAGADVSGLRLIDRFVGTLSPVFRASRLDVDLHYNPPGIRGEPRYLEGVARHTKLHGSLDWVDNAGTIRRIALPFGAHDTATYLTVPSIRETNALHLMIYPNAAKDRETTAYPYVELFRDFAAAICRPNSTLVCYGYGFGDEHINRVIEDMLTIPSTHLVIIAYDDVLGRVMITYENLGRPAQVSLLVGDHLGDLQSLVDHYLPKSAIDRTTIRMADLLKARLGPGRDAAEATATDSTDEREVEK